MEDLGKTITRPIHMSLRCLKTQNKANRDRMKGVGGAKSV